MAEPEPLTRADMRHRRHRRASAAVATFVLVAIAAVGGYVAFAGGDDAKQEATPKPAPPTAEEFTGPNVHANLGLVPLRSATTKGTDIQIYPQPSATMAPVDTLSRITEYLAPRTLLAFDQYQDWLHVYLPTRPNNSTGWVKASDVTLSKPLEHVIRVSLAERKLWMFRNGVVELEAPVAIGMPQYPTPTGTYYFTDPVDLHALPTTSYGVFAMGLSGHSDVLTEFGGGDGQIAIHGTNEPSGIGKEVSHGCVRVHNEVIEVLSTLPLGTPVYIS